jgi:hypothetical protein
MICDNCKDFFEELKGGVCSKCFHDIKNVIDSMGKLMRQSPEETREMTRKFNDAAEKGTLTGESYTFNLYSIRDELIKEEINK